MGLTKLVLKRPVTAILAILCLVVFGIMSVTGATLELSPDMDMSMIIVMTTYSGASPEDVTDLVTKPIEDQIGTLSGLKNITSTSSEGSSMIMCQYNYGTDMDDAYDDLKKKIDLAESDLPDGCDDPVIIEMNSSSMPDISLTVENTAQEDNLYNYVDNEIVPEFEKLSDVADVSMRGGEEQYVRVEMNEEKMKQYGVTMSSITQDIANADITIPDGSADVGSQELTVSTRMHYDTMELLSEIPLTTNSSDIVYLSDVAYVSYANKDQSSIARYDGEDTIMLMLSKQEDSSAMNLSSEAKKTIQSLEAEDPDLKIEIIDDSADSIVDSLASVAETLILAVLISMGIIWLFFGDLKASLIVGSSIPCSILSALILMSAMGFTLNVITLCALTLGVGMVVDNSIVVLESCFRVTASRRGGFVEYFKDALEGTGIVSSSVFASTLTTCVVFIPLALLNGMTGQLFKPLGFTIVFCLSASFISAITVVPLCYMLYRPTEKKKAPLNRPVQRLQHAYRDAMRFILPKKKTVMFTSIALLIGACYLATQLNLELMSSDDQGEVSVTVDTRPGLDIASITEILGSIEGRINEDEDVEHVETTYSSSGLRGSSSASITAYLKKDRAKSTAETVDLWKQELNDIPNCDIDVDINSSMSGMSSHGESYELILQGADYDETLEVSETIKEKLKKRPELTRVHSDMENASPVIEIEVDALKAKANGLTASAVGSTVYGMINGNTPATITVDGDDIDVTVEYPEGEYDSLPEIQNIILDTGNGGKVALTDVADVHYKDSPSSISRKNKQYQVTLTADYTSEATKDTEMEIRNEVVTPNLTETVTMAMNSTDTSMQEEFSDLFKALAIAVFLVFVVMAAQFESPKFSLMVMTTIPFSLIGSFTLLWLTDVSISMVSLIGFLMLIGTAVNNGILYVDTANQYRATMDMETALIEAGATRMRPILMTTLTTVLSMIPTALAIGNAGTMTQGLAIVDIGGLTTSTILCLLMLPTYYLIMAGKQPKDQAIKNSDVD